MFSRSAFVISLEPKVTDSFLLVLGRSAALALVYFFAARLGLEFSATGKNVALIWPPAGVSLAALLLFGVRLWPGIALGAFLASLTTGVSLISAAGTALGNTLEAIAGTYLLNHFTDHKFSLNRIKDVLLLIFLASGLSTMVSATFGALSQILGSVIPGQQFAGTWLVWWMGDAMGDLVFAPAILVWTGARRRRITMWRVLEAAFLVLFQVILGRLVFGDWLNLVYPGVFTTLPAVIWGALRFGARGAAATTLVATMLALWGTSEGSGPFSGRPPIESLTLLWLYANVAAITGLALAATSSERKRAEAGSQLAAKVFESMAESIIITDESKRILMVNKAFMAHTGYTSEEVTGKDPNMLKSGWHDAGFYQNMWASINELGHWQGEVWDRRKNGEVYPSWLSINSVRDPQGRLTNYIAIASDITERKEVEARIAHVAQHDALTNLPNRLVLQDRIEQALVLAKRRGHQVAILCLDLDRFKLVNDTLGHGIGDILLKMVANRLRACLRLEDTVARQGGDEFMIVLPDILRSEEAALMAQQIIGRMSDSFHVRDHELHVGPSIGISIYPLDGEDAQSLMKNADAAMYHAKRAGGNTYRFYAAQMNATAHERLALENSLRYAIDRGQFVLHYQPQVEIATGRLVGMEALLRWQHPTMGLLSPDKFIPLAEETGLIVPIGEWVLTEACKQVALWRQRGVGPFRIAVNISARQFWAGNLLETLAKLLEQTRIPSALLELELTESVLMRYETETVAILEHMSRLGVLISVDDFGTGYSSLGYLKRFAVRKLKIDQSFIAGICENADDTAITTAIIAMAHSLRCIVIAEGVETMEQFEVLKTLGCDEAQGYYLGRPQPAEALAAAVNAAGSQPYALS